MVWLPVICTAIISAVLVKYDVLDRRGDVYALSMMTGFGLTCLFIVELSSWRSYGVGFFQACYLASISEPEFMAKYRRGWLKILTVFRKGN